MRLLTFQESKSSRASSKRCILALSQNRDFTNDDILEAASQIVPLAQTAQQEIQILQEWAASGKARLASRQNVFHK